jgi:hypothetical protein
VGLLVIKSFVEGRNAKFGCDSLTTCPILHVSLLYPVFTPTLLAKSRSL